MMPQAINLAMKPVNKPCTKSNPCADCSEVAKAHTKKPTPTNMITPDIRCRMELMAAAGKLIVFKSKFTGLCFFTIVVPLRKALLTCSELQTSSSYPDGERTL